MSPDLLAFLKAWYEWATNGAPESYPFDPSDGLCDNVEYFLVLTGWQQEQVYDELRVLFGCKIFPFGTDDEYQQRADARTQHLCPKRLAWVRERLIEAGELLPTTQQDTPHGK